MLFKLLQVNQKKIKSSRKAYVMWRCFKFWPMKNIFRKLWANESLIMACLKNYQDLSNLTTFLRVHSNSKEITYLSTSFYLSQNAYPNLKNYLPYQAKIFLVNLTPKELTPFKISLICRCAFHLSITFKTIAN